jgi:hypothetical protein
MQCTILGNIKASLIRPAIFLTHNWAGEGVRKGTDIVNSVYVSLQVSDSMGWASVDDKELKVGRKQEVS